MLVSADLDRFVVFNNREEEDEGVVLMVKEECDSIVDVEEGEISDTDSVKEISEKDFVKQQVSAATTTKNSVGNSNNASTNKPRVWTMQELCSSYSMSPNYSGLVNFAWARAVQNKPLEEVNVMDIQSDEEKPPSVSGKEDNKVVIDEEDEKEEGELEEGEIDLDGDVEQNEGLNLNDMNAKMENGFQRRVNSIRNELQTVTVIEADKSFESVCSRLQKSLDSLHEVISEKSASSVDDLVHLSFAAIQTLNSVLSSMDQNRRDKNKETLRRLLNFLAKQVPPVFLPGQMIEIELMMRSLEHVTSAKTNLNDFDAPKNDQLMRVTESANNLSNKDAKDLMEQLKSGHGSYRGRGMLLPLLDLHKDHDEDSLPSPTGATPSLLPVSKPVPIGGGPVKPEWPVRRQVVENQQPVMHPYETDAVRAVSTYQQRFSLSSFVMNDLPSPTPSEDGNDGEGDTGGEVSSSSISGRVSNVNAPIVNHSVVSSGLPTDMSVSQGLNYFKISGPVAPEPATASKSLTRNRDPRLRLANPDIGNSGMTLRTSLVNKNDNVDVIGHLVSSRKQKNMEEPRSDSPALKRQRNVLEDSEVSGDVQTVSKIGGWLDDTGGAGYNFGVSRRQMVDNLTIEPPKYTSSVSSMAMPNVTSVKDHLSLTGASDTSLLQSLLNNIAVNPTMLASLLNTEHQNTANPATSLPHMTNISSSLGAFPPVDVSFPNPPVSAPVVSGIPQTPRATSMDEDGNACMKPRDPRRVLRKNTLQKGGNLGPDQTKTSAAMISSSQEMKGIQTYKKQEDQSNRMAMSSQCITPPDITQQFTKNLKNIADIMCGPQVSMAPAVVTHVPSSQPWLNNSDKADVKVVTPELSISSSGAASSTEEVVLVAAQPQKTWGDVEHLFEGFDDQQKAAIHKERARRMEEQRKMFDARKLCLVWDLDHTLLNSAKFSEVDPAHDEILRKKEEQDREKAYRHLFRFPHMGMWTKLRPGVWNFLEKASKLFEMHLYTMGNKLYATEMAKLLDPKGVLFDGRVISRGDDNDLIDGDERVPKIKDLDGVLGMESDVVIIDDSIRVWPHNKLNLIAVERYIYFPCSRRQFGLLGPSLLEIDHDERPEDGTLASSLAVIERIHQNFFAHESLEDADVRNILASEQRKILGGCRIVFSRVFPVGQASPHLHPLWQTAEQFGAVCTNQIDDQVTHVVANSMGTDKVNWALSTGRFVVHPGWVEASALLYRRANENDFAVKS